MLIQAQLNIWIKRKNNGVYLVENLVIDRGKDYTFTHSTKRW